MNLQVELSGFDPCHSDAAGGAANAHCFQIIGLNPAHFRVVGNRMNSGLWRVDGIYLPLSTPDSLATRAVSPARSHP